MSILHESNSACCSCYMTSGSRMPLEFEQNKRIQLNKILFLNGISHHFTLYWNITSFYIPFNNFDFVHIQRCMHS